uniref:sperm-specific antigen 2-like n=1 Tax=Monopterus albus TaxID=43700 RepID=UPI0009B30283|nr:sperm-specific antigen 2-like [Monopterus albus]
MDILNLWNDDPEQILLELGFGCDEPDLSGRIPARFINYESQARGINLQVFLEAQKNRLDLENPDVSNRFRQLEVLQQVTTAFSSLMVLSSSPPMRTPLGKDLSPEAQEKRRYMGMLFRRASKKSLSQMHSHKTQEPTPELLHPPPGFGDQKIPLKRLRTGLLETVCLSPLAEEQLDGPVPQTQPQLVSFIAQEGALRPEALKECDPLTVNTFLEKKTGPGQATESFEMEEMSFDEGSFTGSYTRGTENLVRGVIKSNSCQSDSSGFLEEPFIPGPELIKALSGLSGGSTVSQSSKRPGSLSPSAVDTLMLSSPCPSQEPSLLFGPSTSPVPFSLLKSDLQGSEMETPPDAPCPHLSPLPQDSESTAFSAFSYVPSTSSFPSPAPNFASSAMSFPWSDSSSGSPRNTYSEYTEVALHKNVLSASGDLSLLLSSPFAFPPITESLSQSSNNNQKNSSLSDSDRTGLSDTSTNTQNKENKIPFFLTFLLDKDSPSVPSPLVLDSCKFEKGCPSLPSLSPNPSIPSCQSDMPLHHPHGLRDPTAQRKADLTEPSIFQLGQSCSHDGNTDLAPASPVQDIIHVKMDHFTVDLEDTLQRNKKEEEDGEGDTDTMQTQDTVYISDRESSAGLSEGSTLIAGNMCNQTEPDQAVSSDTLYDKLLSKTNQEELRKFSQMESNGKISESASNFILHNEVSEEQSRLEVELIKIDSLDLAFETSVDGSEDENGDVDNFFQQLDTEELS